MLFTERPIAFTDIEATGLEKFRLSLLDPVLVPWHEICEIGLVLVNQKTLEVRCEKNWKTKVPNPYRMNAKAQEINGFDEEQWKDALNLEDALTEYNACAIGAIFAAHNPTYDKSMMEVASAVLNVKWELDYHCIDTWSYALAVLNAKGYFLDSYRLNDLCKFLGLGEEPMPHRAINGARKAFEVYKALRSLPPAPGNGDQVSRCC